MELEDIIKIYNENLEICFKDISKKYAKTKDFDNTFGETFKSISKKIMLNFISCKILLDITFRFKNKNQKFKYLYNRLFKIVEKYNEILIEIINIQNNFKKYNT